MTYRNPILFLAWIVPAVSPLFAQTAGRIPITPGMTSSEAGMPVAQDSEIDVRQYNARADGITDDSDAIAAALDALPASGGTVVLMAGTHRISRPVGIKSNQQLVGRGMYTTTVEVASDIGAVVTEPDAYGWRLKDFAVHVHDAAGRDTTGAAITVGEGNAQWEIDSVIVRRQGTYHFNDGLAITSAWTATVRRFRTEDVLRYPLYMAGGQAILFENCDFSGLGIAACAYVAGNANTFNACKFQGYPVGLELNGQSNTFVCPWFENNYAAQDVWCVHMGGGSQANTFLDGSYTAACRLSGGYFRLTDSACYNTVHNPRFSETTGKLVLLEGAAQYNRFVGGNPAWSTVITQKARGNYYSIRSERNTERIDRWAYGNPEVEFSLGHPVHGLRFRTGVRDVVTDAQSGLYTTTNAGCAPFDAWGDLIVKPASVKDSGVEIWAGAAPARKVRIDESVATFVVPIAPATLPDECARENSIYYSITQGRLAYKDPNGVVNILY